MKNIKKFSFRQGLPHDIELMDLELLFRAGYENITKTHRSTFFQIFWFQEAGPIHLVDFVPIDVQANTLLFLSAETVQRFDPQGGYKGKTILFSKAFFAACNKILGIENPLSLFNTLQHISLIQLEESDQDIPIIFEQMSLEFKKEKDVQQSIILKNLLYNLLLLADRKKSTIFTTIDPKSQDLHLLYQFKELLDLHFSVQKKVTFYASALHMTSKKLNQITKTVLYQSPKKLIDERVMLEAKRMLAYSHKNIKGISFELGFEEFTNFVKFFKKHTKVTPMNFRKASNS